MTPEIESRLNLAIAKAYNWKCTKCNQGVGAYYTCSCNFGEGDSIPNYLNNKKELNELKTSLSYKEFYALRELLRGGELTQERTCKALIYTKYGNSYLEELINGTRKEDIRKKLNRITGTL